jgi:hypothetical protein
MHEEPKKPRIWPGMPFRSSKVFEAMLMSWPAWLVMIGYFVYVIFTFVSDLMNLN